MDDFIPELASRPSSDPVGLDSFGEPSFRAIFEVFDRADKAHAPQVKLALGSVSRVEESPVDTYPLNNLSSYFQEVILDPIPEPSWYDDVFWCCFLALASEAGLPGCYLGGPIHKMIYSVYDDFDPMDVVSND